MEPPAYRYAAVLALTASKIIGNRVSPKHGVDTMPNADSRAALQYRKVYGFVRRMTGKFHLPGLEN
jgi:hypothetical protein